MCMAFRLALEESVLKTPGKAEWKEISNKFMEIWQFPNCLGAVGGKHMRIQAPPESGAQFHNYKSFFSMVLMATCDAQYKFTTIDIGQYGRHMMRPYPRRSLQTDEHRIFNYRLSRARRTIENAFGILCSRWQILHQPLRMSPTNAQNLFAALCVLHHFIMVGEEMKAPQDHQYVPPNFLDRELQDGTVD
ncbi:hypothetical protein FOCC_FOCC013682 [Frankliniella occidentalis]|nr:hypothetical protein FOCC_FOCC013682 [Frankliniella occidentalis]